MMKAIFENIGPIEKAELELGDLTVIAGQNNTGKTYLVYALYGFLYTLQGGLLFYSAKNHPKRLFSEKIKKLAAQIKSEGKTCMDANEFKKLTASFMQEVAESFSSEICQLFGAPDHEFEDAFFHLQIDYKDHEIERTEASPPRRKGALFIKVSLECGEVILELEHPEHTQLPVKLLADEIITLLWEMVQKACLKPFVLSAERVGISLLYKELDFDRNRLVEELQKLSDERPFDPFRFLEQESARYAQPIGDNIDFTRGLPGIRGKKSELPKDKQHSVSNMMDGTYQVGSDSIRFISRRRGDKSFDIPLRLASSSARGLSDLYFYLRHTAKPGQLLIIDGPESHLSPTNQVLMARLLAFCVNSGLKVLITTHSDYLIKEMNNLIMLHGDFEGKSEFLRKHKKHYSENDYLRPESVKAYICEKGTLKLCDVDETGIDMPVFDEAIDKINQISNHLAYLRTPSDTRK